jgi:hypothetical protein
VNFLQNKVIDHFIGASQTYANRQGVVHREDPEILGIIRTSEIDGGRILGVGGGSGYFLDLIKESTNTFHFYNCELTWQAYKCQISQDINLVGGNVLSLPFAENKFDFVIAKNLLHHLVGSTRRSSKQLAQMAAYEMMRVSKRRGYIIVLEQYHQYQFLSSIIFYVTLLFSTVRIRIKSLGLGRNVVVSFLTPAEIRKLFEIPNHGSGRVKIDKAEGLPIPRVFRLFPFLNRLGRLLYIIVVE